MGRLRPDVPRHVHGNPRHSGGRDFAARDPERFGDIARCDELDSDGVFDRRDNSHSVDRLADAGADAALAVRCCDRPLYPRLHRLRLQRQFCNSCGLPRAAGFCRGHADPSRVFRGLPAVSDPLAPGCHHDGRRHGGAGANRRTGGRWLDHRNLVLALAVSDQRCPWRHSGSRHPFPATARATSFRGSRHARRCISGADGDFLGKPGDWTETGPA